MDIHKNARLTLHGRAWIARCVESGQTPKAVALAAGVSPRTVREWLNRYRAWGLAGPFGSVLALGRLFLALGRLF